jgi:putative photosynthetic complex assembly protein 2
MGAPATDTLALPPLDAATAVATAPTPVVRNDLAAGGLFIVARDVGLVLLYWWLATGLIFLIQRDPMTRLLGVGAATAFFGAGLWLVIDTRDDASPRGAMRGFLGAALLWAWPATLLYAGLPAGPADAPLRPLPYATGSWPLAVEAVRATIVNDLIGVAIGAWLAVLTYGRANRIAVWGYLVFWLVQQGAKLNIFFGVAHAGTEFLPRHLRYFERYFGPAENSPLLGATIIALAAVAALLAWRAVRTRSGYQRHGLALLVSVLVLAVVEHLVIGGAFQAPLWEFFLEARGY